jgi:hypothetical protein
VKWSFYHILASNIAAFNKTGSTPGLPKSPHLHRFPPGFVFTIQISATSHFFAVFLSSFSPLLTVYGRGAISGGNSGRTSLSHVGKNSCSILGAGVVILVGAFLEGAFAPKRAGKSR